MHNYHIDYSETYVRLVNKRTLFFCEEFTHKSCTELSTMLLYLDSKNDDIITLYINSPGGVTNGLIQVYDVINMLKSKVRTICMGEAYSCGAVLLSSGTKGERYATSTSQIMIHGISSLFPSMGMTVAESENRLSFLQSHNDDFMKILAKNTNNTLAKIKQDCKIDFYLTAESAKKYGLIDHVI